MKRITRHWLAAVVTVCLLLSLTACGGDKPESSAPTTTTTTTATAASTTTSTTAATTTTTAAPKPQLGYNPLTGRYDMATANNRPIGFMVSDESSSLVQLNLESADMYIEAETEGGIPRIFAIYSSVDRIPSAIGPVRSARPHFVRLANALDAIYCHIGGSKSGLSEIKKLGVDDLNNAYEINSILKNSDNFSWNRSAFTKSKVLAQLGRISTTSDVKSPFQFGEKAGSQTANTVDLRISESYHMSFEYDSAAGVYVKNHNSLSSGEHKTYTGGPITASNVIIMYAKRFVDQVEATTTRYDFELTSGVGVLACGGTARNIVWKVTSEGLRYYESDGTTPLTVAEGKTFVCLTSTGLKGDTKLY